MEDEVEVPVEPQEVAVEETQEAPSNVDSDDVEDSKPETQVPLSALQKERRKRQELEIELRLERERRQATPTPPEQHDDSKYESATREDLSRSQLEAVRMIEERLWIKQNPEKYQKVNDDLPAFLKQRPNLATAINDATNRYEEAYMLMDALTPKQRQQMKESQVKKPAPGAPGAVPKAAAMNQAVDVMSMSDAEFTAWRAAQKKRR